MPVSVRRDGGRYSRRTAEPAGNGHRARPLRPDVNRGGFGALNVFPPSQIRNVVLVGHGGSGKTMLGETILLNAGAINRIGGVLDHDPEEREKGLSMSLALAQFPWRNHKINLLDTPGFPDFIGEVAASLAVADLAVFVISAVDGIEVQTEIIWKMAEAQHIPRALFVNKMDRERANFDAALAQAQERFGSGVVPLQLPIGAEASFRGVADLLAAKAYTYEGATPPRCRSPTTSPPRRSPVRDNLVEGIVSTDDELLEKYLDGEVPSPEQLAKALGSGVAQATVFPVVCGSATMGIGVDRLLDLVCEVGPSPLDRGDITVVAGGETMGVTPDPNGDPLAFVFKSVADRHVGQLSLIKVVSGTVKADDHLVDSRSGGDVRLHSLLSLKGAEQTPTPEAPLGDLVAVAKLNDVHTNDTLAPKGKPVTVPRIQVPPPTLPVAIHARTQADEDKLSNAVARLLDEDTSLRLERNDQTRQTVLWGQGESHVRTSIDRLQRKFGVGVDTDDVKVAYRETIQGTAEAEGKHKKQSGGRGQFGVCFLRVARPGPGRGLRVRSTRSSGGPSPASSSPRWRRAWWRPCTTAARSASPSWTSGSTVFDGKFHAVDSDEMSFKIAGRQGFREACSKANPVSLEPVSRVEITVPADVQGDVLGDLNSRRGRVQGTEAAGNGEQLIVALVPTSELLRYAIDLRSLSGGRGRFTFEFDHYDTVPGHLMEKILAEAKAEHS